MGTYTQYSATASSNNGAAPVGAPEGVAPGSVNDIIREVQATIRTLGNSVADGTLPGSGTPIPLTNGGTGANHAGGVRASIGLGTVATYNVGSAAGEIPTNAQVVGQVPIGGIIMWWGTIWTWPSNYLPCDGTNGTPDLRGRVPVCPSADFAYTTSGGSLSQTTSSAGTHTHGGATGAGGDHSHGGVTGGTALSTAQMPSHQHYMFKEGSGEGVGTYAYRAWFPGHNTQYNIQGQSSAPDVYKTELVGGSAAHDHTLAASGTHTHGIVSDGSHQHTVDVRQPWMSLWFLMRVS